MATVDVSATDDQWRLETDAHAGDRIGVTRWYVRCDGYFVLVAVPGEVGTQ